MRVVNRCIQVFIALQINQLKVVEDQMAVSMETVIEKLNQYGEAVTFLGDGVPVFHEFIAEK